MRFASLSRWLVLAGILTTIGVVEAEGRPRVELIDPSALPSAVVTSLTNAVAPRPIIRWERRVYPDGWVVYAAIYRGWSGRGEAEVDVDRNGRLLGGHAE